MTIKVSVGTGLHNENWDSAAIWASEVERLGVDTIWSAETWGFDATSPLAFLASHTNKINLGTGIMQIGARSPANIAMTALSLASMTNNRFILGLGTSGPQVIEGWHGVNFDLPYTRLKETIEIIKLISSGERSDYKGKKIQLPLPNGEGVSLRSSVSKRKIPIYLATLGPRSLRLTGAIADGWLASSFLPESGQIFIDDIKNGAEQSKRELKEITLCAGGVIEFNDDIEPMIQARKPGFAFEIGAMGSPQTNYYRNAYNRQGYSELTTSVLDLWLAGKRDEAAHLIPDDFVTRSNFLGTDEMVKNRIYAYKKAGVNNLRVNPAGKTLKERLDTLGRFMDLVKSANMEKNN